MSKETAESVAMLMDRLTKPVLAILFCASICWMGIRTVTNISADQFVGIVMMVAGFYFGRAVAAMENARPTPTATATTTAGGTATAEAKP